MHIDTRIFRATPLPCLLPPVECAFTNRPHRSRVHQSLVDRIFFMAEDEVTAELSQQGRGLAGRGRENSDSCSENDDGDGGGDGGGVGGKDASSSVATPPPSRGGATSSGVGPRRESNQLLVLLGDAGGTRVCTYANENVCDRACNGGDHSLSRWYPFNGRPHTGFDSRSCCTT